ncbi:alpha/beta hydrolase [Macrococcus equi]|uniref:alpha/beta hydrolase n=1 Tax=Macrococcus equi TaxID=3395462 RepID=UPI0039BE501B
MKKGFITPYEITSNHLNRTVKIGVYFPIDYSPFEEHHLIICFDGQDVSQIGQIHRKYEQLVSDGLEAAVFVFVHYTDTRERRQEYHPEGALRSNYQQFVAEELLIFLKDGFNLKHSKENTVLVGDSLAASIALTLTIEQPEIASNAILFSPMITEAIISDIAEIPEKVTSQLNYYLIVGKNESHFKLMTGDYANFLTPIQHLHQTFQKHSIQHYYAEIDGGHTWKTWKPQLENCLNYYLS